MHWYAQHDHMLIGCKSLVIGLSYIINIRKRLAKGKSLPLTFSGGKAVRLCLKACALWVKPAAKRRTDELDLGNKEVKEGRTRMRVSQG